MDYPKGEYLLKDLSKFRVLKAISGIYCNKNNKVQYACLLFCRIILIYYVPGQIAKYIKLNKYNVNTTVEFAVPFACLFEMLIRNIFYHFKYNEYHELHAYVKQHFWPLKYLPDKKKRETIEKLLRYLQYGSVMYPIFLTLTQLMYCFHPMVETVPGEKHLPIRLWLPFDTNPPVVFFNVFFFMLVIGCLGVLCIGGTDLLFIYFLSHLFVQIIILRSLLERLTDVTLDNEHKEYSLIENKTYQKIIYERLTICTAHHAKLLTFQAKLQQLFSGILSFQLLLTTIFICVMGYAFIETEETTKKINHTLLLLSASAELMIYCITGSMLEYQSDEILTSLYNSKWYRGNKKFRKAFLFLQYHALYQPFTISAMGIVFINNLCIVQVYKLAFSAITMLQTLQEK